MLVEHKPLFKKVEVEGPTRPFFPLSDIMDLRHQSSAMCIIMLGGEDTHPWSATKLGNPIPATIPVAKRNNQQTTHTGYQSLGLIPFDLIFSSSHLA